MKRSEIKDRVHRIAEALAAHAHAASAHPASYREASSSGPHWREPLSRMPDLVLLDEPLANLDFKLREELARRAAKAVCRSSQHRRVRNHRPHGCATAWRTHGRRFRKGASRNLDRTAEIYRRPGDLRTAQVFSNPPINTAPVTKQGEQHCAQRDAFAGRQRPACVSCRTASTSLASGRMTSAPFPTALLRLGIDGKVQITEISGSESMIHFAHAALKLGFAVARHSCHRGWRNHATLHRHRSLHVFQCRGQA